MRLYQALGVQAKEIITVVGAGGKTSALICLARELAAMGRRVVVAPTTKMLLSQLRQLAEPVITSDTASLAAGVAAGLKRGNLVTCGSGVTDQGKVTGLDAAGVTALAELDIDYLLLEGDGAAGALIKAPAAHEPVIPPVTTLVVTVAGLPVLGRPLAAPFVHRPRLAAGLLGREEGSLVTAHDVARVLAHPRGGRKGVPPAARWVVLLNQAEDYELLRAGRSVAGAILAAGGEKVVLGAVATPAPVRQVLLRQAVRPGPVGAIVLAAGAGERYGGDKQLLSIAGQPMVRRVVTTALAAVPGNVVVVLGHEAGRVAAALEGLAADIAYNPGYRRGLSTSLQAGLAALGPESRAALFVLADQPGVTPDVITRLAGAYRQEGKKIIVPVYQGRRGNPVLIDRDLWPQILALQGDVGAREIIRAHPEEVLTVEVDCPGILKDIDTHTDYQAWLHQSGN
ncbi:selenium cofactor biosynthesis protein YqeC [Neomoorella mulderi]|uniref:Nicotine blue oxidoreductase n=1 Tax=Moorella mulderi DSM 14980 TaxID=1122241 RepID=A0A151AWD0_9FIRM|nr:selenium cofactor biosynthesis protein YqeC [Moorella mulderi]KYH31956.1 nicotine blue oxidoreductase [Moorella mulderi DSM 14980]